MQLTFQVLVSALIVLAVLFFMWRLPRKGESFFGWAPLLAMVSAWAGLIAVVWSALLWLLPAPDLSVTMLFLIVDPLSIGAGVLVLWIYRGYEQMQDTVTLQLVQAKVGIVLGLAAVTIGYVFVMTHKAPLTPVGL